MNIVKMLEFIYLIVLDCPVAVMAVRSSVPYGTYSIESSKETFEVGFIKSVSHATNLKF